MTDKYESMQGILRLYELRREETMRKAREWFFRFNPESADDISAVFLGPQSGYYRMVTSYWDMAACFVNAGAIDEQMFNDTTNEHIAVFAKVAPFVEELRTRSGVPHYLAHLEQLVTRLPDAATRMERMREIARNIGRAQAAAPDEAEPSQT
jgi:hypothetical protein